MRLPRDLSGSNLAQALRKLGYSISRQTGSHLRLTTQQHGEHHLTIPQHTPLRIGTLSAILADVATHFEVSRDQLLVNSLGEDKNDRGGAALECDPGSWKGAPMTTTVKSKRHRPRIGPPCVLVDDESVTYAGSMAQDEMGRWSRNQALWIWLTACGQPTMTLGR